MTLYIAWILLYHFHMEWWWYGGAILAYLDISVSKSTSLVMNIKSPRLSASDRMSHFTIKTIYRRTLPPIPANSMSIMTPSSESGPRCAH